MNPNRPELYKKTCNILFESYFNDTLQHNNFCGCAAGNIIAANMGIKMKKREVYGGTFIKWDHPVHSGRDWFYKCSRDNYYRSYSKKLAEKEIASTGYKVHEIQEIERAFEAGMEDKSHSENNMFKGLCNVLDVLKSIHNIVDDTQTERFTKHYNIIRTLKKIY